ncbi:recombinase family protein [Roseicella aquatilis]|uniref:Resolvase n=1 Tax=Roseicella aquatilis TaxID=2527868 RepID=A0A4R4DVH4_9PROT|nr:recombinase family protein [Roseicella aquatilis]TCZ64450.1 resolvase [Roseicella aquatilis]
MTSTTTGSPQGRTFVAYARVSTQQQGRSGLGLEAQEAAIRAFLRPEDRLLAPIFVEVESGRRTDRPELAKAIARCRTTGATLLIAKLDRLSRDAHFLLGLSKAGVEFVAADMPHANRLTVGIMALVAEEEARAISARTKAALAAAKARGVKLGAPKGTRPAATQESIRSGAKASAEARSMTADHRAHAVLPAVEELRAEGATSLHQLASGLNARGVPTPRGNGAWTATAVRRVLLRASGKEAA